MHLGQDTQIFLDGVYRFSFGYMPSLHYRSQLGSALFALPYFMQKFFKIEGVWTMLPLFISANILFLGFFTAIISSFGQRKSSVVLFLILFGISICCVIAPIRMGEGLFSPLSWHRIYNNAFIGFQFLAIYFVTTISLVEEPFENWCLASLLSFVMGAVAVYLFFLKFTYMLGFIGLFLPLFILSDKRRFIPIFTIIFFASMIGIIHLSGDYLTYYINDILAAANNSSVGLLSRIVMELWQYRISIPVLCFYTFFYREIIKYYLLDKSRQAIFLFIWFFVLNFFIDVFDSGPIKVFGVSAWAIAILLSILDKERQNFKFKKLRFNAKALMILLCAGLFSFVGIRLIKMQQYQLEVNLASDANRVVQGLGFRSASEYRYFDEGVKLYQKAKAQRGALCVIKKAPSIAMLDLADGISWLASAPVRRSSHLWVDYGVSMSKLSQPSFIDFVGEAPIILLPKHPLVKISAYRLYHAYRQNLAAFKKVKNQDWVAFYRC